MKLFTLVFFMAINLQAEEININSFANGSCWYQKNEIFKLSSFNEKESISLSSDQLPVSLLSLVPTESKEIQNIFLHCGSQGASFVTTIKSENGHLCLWAMLDHGKLKIRSIGGSQLPSKGDSPLCDGFKQGELLVVLKNHDYLNQLRNENWSSIVKEIIPVAFNIYKIKLTPEYFSREIEVAKMFENEFHVMVEFNQYQHGVGEYVQLK